MLIDFSDMLQVCPLGIILASAPLGRARLTRGLRSPAQVNVFTLGSTYLKLVKTLNLQLPVMDPSLYISRFAALLEFQDETQKVAHDATRLVQRFSRDWMDTGRRPAGICGACLLLAARMNNFRRSIEEIVQVVKIADTTLKKRLDEFKATASGGLSITEFRSMWLEETHDPPAYTTSVRKMKRSESELLNDDQAETSSQGAERSRSRSRSTSATPAGGRKGKNKGKGKEVSSLDSLPEEGSPGPGRPRLIAAGDADGKAVFQAAADFDDGAGALADEGESMIDPSLFGSPTAPRNALLPASSSVAGATFGEEEAANEATEKDGHEKAEREDDEGDELDDYQGEKADRAADDGAADAAITGELDSYLSSTQAQLLSTELTEAERRREERRLKSTGDLDLDDIDEAELDGFLLTEEEVQIKTRVWMEYNKDYLEKLARASSPPLLSSACRVLLPSPPPLLNVISCVLFSCPANSAVREAKAHGEAGNGPKKPRKKRANVNPRGATPAESAKNLVQKKFSRKINYGAFENLFAPINLPQKMSASQLRGSEAPSGHDSDDAGNDGKEKADRQCSGPRPIRPTSPGR